MDATQILDLDDDEETDFDVKKTVGIGGYEWCPCMLLMAIIIQMGLLCIGWNIRKLCNVSWLWHCNLLCLLLVLQHCDLYCLLLVLQLTLTIHDTYKIFWWTDSVNIWLMRADPAWPGSISLHYVGQFPALVPLSRKLYLWDLGYPKKHSSLGYDLLHHDKSDFILTSMWTTTKWFWK